MPEQRVNAVINNGYLKASFAFCREKRNAWDHASDVWSASLTPMYARLLVL